MPSKALFTPLTVICPPTFASSPGEEMLTSDSVVSTGALPMGWEMSTPSSVGCAPAGLRPTVKTTGTRFPTAAWAV